jgi:eukaryotic-like serine/threonine-protein kinase
VALVEVKSMAEWNPRANDVFLRAAEIAAPAERQAFLDEQCGADAALRQEVESLLAASAKAGTFLNEPVVGRSIVTVDEVPISEGPGTVIGPYKLLQKIGEGGFGVVCMAEQEKPVRRMVALKIIKPGMDTAQVIARFESERQALALMDHPNIAKVLDAGATDSGRPYFVMELVKGVPITDFCDKNHMPAEQRLKLFLDVCHAIQHAHHKGVIHRDVKPTNVLVTLHDGEPVVKVIDFGVAKATVQKLTERTLFTAYGQMIGTPAYMSPEQAEMSGLDIDTRSDVYSLGVLLYELLTGTTPLESKRLREAGYSEMQRLIREEEAPRPSNRLSSLGDSATVLAGNRGLDVKRLVQLLAGDLDWVVMKALDKDRSRRYDTPGHFAEDVERYLRREAILARPPSTAYKLKKFAQRNRAAVLTAAAVTAALMIGMAVAIWQAVRASNAERDAAAQRDVAVGNEQKALSSEAVAQQKRQEALAAQEELRDTLYSAEMNLIQAAWESDNLPRIRDLLSAQIPKKGQRDLRGFEWHYWDRLCHAEANLLQLPDPFPETPWALPMFARDGIRLAAVVPKGGEHELQVWDATTGIKRLAVALPGGRKRTYFHAISADGERIATMCGSEAREKKAAPFDLRVRDANTGNEIGAITVPGVGPEQTPFLSMSADGSRVATVVVSVNRPILSPLSPTATSQLTVWNTATGKAMFTVSFGSVRSVPVLSADGSRVAAIVSLDGKGDIKSPHAVKMWDVATGKELQLFKGSSGEPFSQVVFSPDGKRLAATGMTLGADGIWIWDAATGKELRAIGGRRTASLLLFSPDGKYLANYSRNGATVTLWDLATGQPWSVFKGHTSGVISAGFNADGRQLRTVTLDGTIRTWNIPAIVRPSGMSFSSIRFAHVAISPDGTRIADLPMFGSESDRIEILDSFSKRIRSIPLPNKGLAPTIDRLVLNRGGTRLAVRWNATDSAGESSHVRVWDTSNGKELLSHKGEGRLLLAISPDGSRVAVPFAVGAPVAIGWKRIGGVKVIDVTNGQEIQTLELNPHPNLCIAEFTPDGKRLATESLFSANSDPHANQIETTGQIWDLATGKEIERLKSDTGGGSTMTFSPDGSLLAVGYLLGRGGTGQAVIDVLETETSRKRFTLRGHSDRVVAIAFSPDGRRIASSSQDPTIGDSEIRIWDAVSGKGLSTWTCHGGISGLAFRPDGRQLIGVRAASPDTELGTQVWDATPRTP